MHKLTYILMAIGGLNWLAFGLSGYDVSSIWGGSMMDGVARTIYVLVGVATIFDIAMHKKMCKECGGSSSM